ncbi:Gfo/Idh/MocA family oxidoreductase [candidate division KSB1 bacterium]
MKNKKNDKSINRRKFLGYTAATGAGLIISRMAHADKRIKKDELNIALLGAGSQGQVLLNACLKIPGLRFKAVCDIWTTFNQKRAVRLLRKYGHDVNGYVDYRDMLANEKDLDAVIIATPDFWHAEHTINCMKAGLHVYCEKEMSNSLEDAKQMVLASKETGRLLQIGHQRRSNPRYIHCYEKLIKGSNILGRITTINSQWNRAVQPDLGWPKKYAVPQDVLRRYGFESMQQFRNWRWYKKLGGGPIVDLGSHQIDIFNWFLDDVPYSVVASGGTDYYDKKSHEWYDTVMAIYEFHTGNGIIRAFYQTLTTNSNQGYFETFMGDQGTLYLSESAGRGGIYREQTAPEWTKWVQMGYLKAPTEEEKSVESLVLDVRETIAPPKHEIPVVFNDPYHKPHLENFFNTVRGNDTLNCPAEIGYETAVTVLKVNQAVKTGRKLLFNRKEFKI